MRKIAHVGLPSQGMPMWAYPRWVTPSPAQTQTVLDQAEAHGGTNVNRWSEFTGLVGTHVPQTLPSSTRVPRIAAFHASNPAVFQSYFRVRWESMFGAAANLQMGSRRVNQIPNPFIPGTKEGQAIMTYDPWPSAGELYPKAL